MEPHTNQRWIADKHKPGYYRLYAETVEVAKIFPSRREQADHWGYTLSTRNYGEGFRNDPRNYNLTLGAAMDRGEHHLEKYQEQSLAASHKEDVETRYQSGQDRQEAQALSGPEAESAEREDIQHGPEL